MVQAGFVLAVARQNFVQNEKHDSCFDCLDHHALSLDELKCEICVDWVPHHWEQATAYYPSDSPARLAALTLGDRERLGRVVSKSIPPGYPFP